MPIKILTAKLLIKYAPKRWTEHYKDYTSYNAKDIHAKTKKLNALVWPFSKSDIDNIIGNTSWTELECDCCGKGATALAHVQDTFEETKVSICTTCAGEAFAKLLTAK